MPAVLLVTNTNDAGGGSLRAAIDSANTAPATDTIKFDLPGSGVRTITLASPLPQILANRPVTIDGWSQPGFSSAPLVQISAGASTVQYGLSVFASNSVFRGLIFSGFANASIAIWGGDNHKIQGNYLGSNATGSAVVGSSFTAALYLAGGSASNVIGVDGDGTSDALEGNLLVGSSQMGLWLDGSGTTGNRVAGNRIGISKSGTDLGNAWGIYVSGGASNNIIGSNNDGVADSLEANIVSGSDYSGVAIVGSTSLGNRISRNFVYGNDRAEIDLEDDGITANDSLDADSGANKRSNYPVIRSLTTTATTVTVGGTLRASASAAYRLEFFAAASSDSSGHGGSQRFLGGINVTTSASGVATFSKSFRATLPYGWVVSATATDAAGNTSEFSPAIWQGADLTKTFELHSNPSATKVIYLDFNGHTATDTRWNSDYGRNTITIPAYSTDSSSSFSEQELFNVQRIFHSIAEDFRPFQVNVTTQEPPLADLIKDNESDLRWGIRAAIGGYESSVLGSGNAGGRAYNGSFNWDSDTPALVFSKSLTNGNVQSVAVATSHEVGHTLGLDHDGQGELDYYAGHGAGATSWGPIMGNPYGKSVSQWSQGDYLGATNGEDDLTIITTQNGFTYRNDDYASTLASAAPLGATNGQVFKTGIIARTTDVDLFTFTVPAGRIDLKVSPDAFDPNLDIRLQLLNSSGQQVVASGPGASLGARIVATVPEGKYYLRVEGVGIGSPLSNPPTGYIDYGSLGFYAITGKIPSSQPPLIALSGTIGYTRNATAGVQLAAAATVSDPDSPNFANGSLIVSIISGGELANRLTLTGGAFTLSGASVQHNGLTIGSLSSNGYGTKPLEVQFNVNATPAIVQELARNIRFRTVNSVSNSQRVITFNLSDGDGSTSNTATKTVNVTG